MRFDPFDMSRLLPERQSEADITLAPTDPMLWAHVVARLRSGHFGGPLYRYGRVDLEGRLAAAFAAL